MVLHGNKVDAQHIVPLSRQAVEILTELHPLTERIHYVFPGARGAARPMSDNVILAAMRRIGDRQGRNEWPRLPRDGENYPR